MKNIKNFILIATLAATVLTSTITTPTHLPISAQTGKKLCYATLTIASLITMNGLTMKNPIQETKEVYNKSGLRTMCTGLIAAPFFLLFDIFSANGLKFVHTNNSFTIGGAVTVAGSIAGIRYFNRQIEAQKSSNSLVTTTQLM